MPTWLALIPAVSDLLDRIIPDPQAREAAKLALANEENAAAMQKLQMALQEDQAQTQINAVEAQNGDLFVSGWRPFIGWVCGVAFAYHFVVQPLLAFIIANSGREVHLPVFQMEELSTVLMGLLGLGGLRTLEKISKGKAQS
jgi:hypothetical protein